eukprot:maker-scaffold626_size122949-snap-gene-0.33 protein:Tk11484 transcript:maker-scaffold626_size122949-snap-gene-0.33-mRNA-1 annotation:"set and mynd domain-containing protein 4-like"
MFAPNRKGFMPVIYNKFEHVLAPEVRAAFLGLKTNEERLKFFLELPHLIHGDERDLMFLIRPVHGDKNDTKSVENREAGNASFYAGNFRQAQILYSSAVFWASEKSGNFPLALANRSAAFQQLSAFDMAIQDIDMALKSGYPVQKSFKLYERKGECLESLKAFPKAALALGTAVKYVGFSSMPKDRKAQLVAKLKAKADKLDKIDPKDTPPRRSTPTRPGSDQIIIVEEPNPRMPAIHKSIEIQYEPNRGRFAVATEDIPMGTPLVHEKPLIHALHPDKMGINCQNCTQAIKAVIPCLRCIWVCFCSEACRDAAWHFHRIECGILKVLTESGLNVYSFLSLRATSVMGLDRLKAMRDQLEARDEQVGVGQSDGKVYRSEDFINSFNLVSLDETISPTEWVLRTLAATFLVRLLRLTPFFDDSEDVEEDSIFIGAILLQVLNTCAPNCHDISEYETPVLDKFTNACSKVSIGAAIYPSLALFNHGCNPDFMRCNRGNSVLCVANRLIKKGEEICENYGLMFTIKPLEERQSIIKEHYKFTCQCQACQEDWPLLSTLKSNATLDSDLGQLTKYRHLKCIHCGQRLSVSEEVQPNLQCSLCGQETHILSDVPLPRVKELTIQAVDELVRGQWESGIEDGRECQRLIARHMELPVVEQTEVQIALWKSMWLQWGNLRLIKF